VYVFSEIQIIYIHFLPHTEDSLSPLQKTAGQISQRNNQSFYQESYKTHKYRS